MGNYNSHSACYRWGLCGQVDVTTVQHQWVNFHTIYSPAAMCTQLNGSINNFNVCTIDFSNVDSTGLTGLIAGVNTADELCGILQGGFDGAVCTVNFEGAGTGPGKDKKAACGELKGKWEQDECLVETVNMAG